MSNGPGKGRGAWYYLPVDSEALKMIDRLTPEQKVKLVEELPKMFFDNEYEPTQTEDLALDMIVSIIWSTARRLREGAEKRNTGTKGNTLGITKNTLDVVEDTIDTPMDINQDNIKETDSTIIKLLHAQGYTEEEIDYAISKMGANVKNKYKYLKTIMDNKRKENKTTNWEEDIKWLE